MTHPQGSDVEAGRMRIGLLTQWYEPEPGPAALPAALARKLVDRGHDVRVLTGFPNYPSGRLAEGYRLARRLDEVRDGVRVRRVALYPSHDASRIGRAANYGSFGISALASGLDVLGDIDALWVNYSPITVAWPMWAAGRRWKIPAVVHVLDLWPDTLSASSFAGSGVLARGGEALIHRWCDAMYRSARSVAYISPSVGDVLRSRGVPDAKLAYVPMWANEKVFRPGGVELRREFGIADDLIVLLYAGTLGEAQGLRSLLDACKLVRHPRFACLIAGSGVSESALRRHAHHEKIQNVRFIGRVAQSRMTDLMATADLAYVSLRPHRLSRMTMPSKIQASLAAGRALLVAAEGDAARIAEASGAGFAAPSDDPQAIAASIEGACAIGRDGLRSLGARAREFYEREFSLDEGVRRLESLLRQAAASRARR